MYVLYQIVLESPSKGYLMKINKIFMNIKKFSFCEVEGPLNLPSKIKKFTVLKSPHVFKKSREQFESLKVKVVFFIKIHKKNTNVFSRIFKLMSWSYLGISMKKTKMEKKYLFF